MNTSSPQSIAYERRWWVLAVLAISVFLVVVDNLIVNVALPTLQSELNASTTALQWIVDSYALVFAGLLLAGGGLGDRFGRKGALQIGLVLFVTCSTFAAFATTSNQLIFWRGAMGIGAALVFPATLAIITNIFVDPIERAKAIGLWSAVSGMAVAFGPIVGGALLKHYWWGSVFLVNIPIVAIALIAGAFLVPKSRDEHPHRIDAPGFLLSVLAVGSLVYTVIESPNWGWGSMHSNIGFGIAVIAFAAFVAAEMHNNQPLLDVRVFANPRLSAAAGSIFIAFFCLFGFTFLVTQYFQFVLGYDTLSSGIHTIPFAVGAGVTAPFAARAALRFGTKRVVAMGLLNMAIGLAIASRMDQHSSYWGHIIIGMVFMANGLSLVTSPSTDAIMGTLNRDKAGVGSAINDVGREVGGTLGVAIVGSVFVSLYTPKLADTFSSIPGLVQNLPAGVFGIAQKSVGAAYQVAGKSPAALQDQVRNAVSTSFISGFQVACVVASCVALVGSITALLLLPSATNHAKD
jgi:EmrB/QacA subfamily drug resistance transporter